MRPLFLLLGWLLVASVAAAQGSFTSIGGPPGGRIVALVAHPSGSAAMLQDSRLFCSFDDGQTWATPEILRTYHTFGLPPEGNALLAATLRSPYSDEPAQVWLSTDGCRSWRDVTGQDIRAERAVKVASGWFVRGDSSRLLHSTDQGATWQTTGGTSAKAPKATGNGDVFAILSNYPSPVLARWSADSTKWTPLKQYIYYASLVTGPGDALAVASATPIDLYQTARSVSYDAGRTWQFLSFSESGSLAFGPDKSLYYLGDTRWMRRLPNGTETRFLPDSLRASSVSVLASGTVLASVWEGNGQLLFRQDANGVWAHSGTDVATSAPLAVTTENGRLLAANTIGAYEYGKDGRWRAANAISLGVDPLSVGPIESIVPKALHAAPWGTVYQLDEVVHIATKAGKSESGSWPQGGSIASHGDSTLLVALGGWFEGVLRRSVNRGQTWLSMDSVAAGAVVRLKSGRIVVASSWSRFMYVTLRLRTSDDGGATWSPAFFLGSSPEGSVALIELPGTSSVVLVTNHTLYRSDDEGSTWMRVGDGCLSPTVVAALQERGVLACYNSYPYRGWTLWSTSDGFRNRVLLDIPPFEWPSSEIHMHSPRLPMALLDDGRLVLPAEEGGLRVSAWPVASNEAETATEAAAALSVWPNPARQLARVRVAATGAVRVEVFDLLGRRLATLHDGPASGTLDLALDASRLPSGVYVVRMTGEASVQTARFVVQR